MKSYFKQCKNTKQVNAFLKKLGLGEFMQFDDDYDFSKDSTEFDLDTWVNAEEKKGVSIQVHPNYEVFVTKYTKKDIEKCEAEI